MRNIFQKTNVSNSLIRTRTCAYQEVRNVNFAEDFAYKLNGLCQNSQINGSIDRKLDSIFIYNLSVCIIDLVLVILVLFRLEVCIVKPKVFKFLSLKFLYVYINSNARKSMITFDINDLAQPALTCSKLSTETQGQGVKYVQS